MRALVVHAHPHPDSYSAALRDRVVETLTDVGAEVSLVDLWRERFDPRLAEHEHRTHHIGLPERPAIAPYATLLQQADTLVFVYPTWWGGPPAMLKGWLDRVLCDGVAYTLPPGGDRIRPLLRHVRRLVVVTTYGSPRWVNALQGEPGKRTLRWGLRTLLARRASVHWLGLYRMDTNTDEDRQRFLDEVAQRLRRLGS